jgi:RHS repeat-associated protein
VIESYAYDANGNRTSWTNGYGSFSASYDDQDRLLQVTPSSGPSLTYTYTAAGMLRTKKQSGQTVTTTYDDFGNLLRVDTADGIAVEYVHDGLNRRVAKKVTGVVVKGWIYSTGGLPVAETNAEGAITTRFVYATGRVPDYFVRDGAKYRVFTEPNGSVRFVVQVATGAIAQQIDYDSYGNVTFDSNPGFQPFGYAGGLYEWQTGFVRFGARDYDPFVGRWTAKDPIGFAGGETGFYTYVGNDPVNLVDPSGRASRREEQGREAADLFLSAWDVQPAIGFEFAWAEVGITAIMIPGEGRNRPAPPGTVYEAVRVYDHTYKLGFKLFELGPKETWTQHLEVGLDRDYPDALGYPHQVYLVNETKRAAPAAGFKDVMLVAPEGKKSAGLVYDFGVTAILGVDGSVDVLKLGRATIRKLESLVPMFPCW